MSIFPASDEGEKIDIVPNRWVRFTRGWDWNVPGRRSRATKHFPAGVEIRLTRSQFQSAVAAGVAVSIQNPRSARTLEADHGGPADLDNHP